MGDPQRTTVRAAPRAKALALGGAAVLTMAACTSPRTASQPLEPSSTTSTESAATATQDPAQGSTSTPRASRAAQSSATATAPPKYLPLPDGDPWQLDCTPFEPGSLAQADCLDADQEAMRKWFAANPAPDYQLTEDPNDEPWRLDCTPYTGMPWWESDCRDANFEAEDAWLNSHDDDSDDETDQVTPNETPSPSPEESAPPASEDPSTS